MLDLRNLNLLLETNTMQFDPFLLLRDHVVNCITTFQICKGRRAKELSSPESQCRRDTFHLQILMYV